MVAGLTSLDARFEPVEDARAVCRTMMRSWIMDRGTHVVVACDDIGIIGYAVGAVDDSPRVLKMGRFGHISDIYVAPAWRQNGVGRELLHALRSWFRRQGLSAVDLNVADSNAVAQAFWRSMGFQGFTHRMWLEI
jgi:ribosomal protein S18 acetylase RimI-like enzyme